MNVIRRITSKNSDSDSASDSVMAPQNQIG